MRYVERKGRAIGRGLPPLHLPKKKKKKIVSAEIASLSTPREKAGVVGVAPDFAAG